MVCVNDIQGFLWKSKDQSHNRTWPSQDQSGRMFIVRLALAGYTAGTVEFQHLKVHVKGKLSWSNCFCEVA